MMAAGATATAAGPIFPTTTQALAAPPRKGGRLVMAIAAHSPGGTLDPAIHLDGRLAAGTGRVII